MIRKRCVTYEHLGFRTYKRSEIQELYSKWGAIFCTSGSDLCNSTNFMLKYTKNEKRCYKHGKEK